ncbi:nucleosidase [Corynebacterium uterequi]|uniref:Nucleoside phosphorylase n=1 Tax=Corynebacterium uterequi TaxID=1072256 RepID=A0A0G3HGR5_9CORY|nr:nucleosidase [Corynebacterium uterequi]AKK11965.1 nucleoside phosphorylase [Corynebacterium uterequi]
MENVLLVSATAAEAAHLPEGTRVLVTGIGTASCGVELATYLANPDNPLPDRIVNFGTAGALRDGLGGVFEIIEVFQHDFSQEVIEEMTGRPFPNARVLEPATDLPSAVLATGDSFVSDDARRVELARRAELVDMEGYIVARMGAAFGIPVTLIKQVSDRADAEAKTTWAEAVDAGARELARELRRLGWA